MADSPADILNRLTDAGLRPPETATLAITNRCNLRCRHCWPESGPDENAPAVPKTQVRRLIDDLVALGAQKLVITGGEPLIHPDWHDILVHACSRSGVAEVRLQTNAILISPAHVQALASLKDRGLVIQTSLEGASATPHDRVRGAGSFERTMQGLQLLLDADWASRICITFTEMRHNFDEIPDLLALADDLGVGQFITGTLVAGGRAAESGGLMPPTPGQYAALLERYRHDGKFNDRYRRLGTIAALEWFLAPDAATDGCCALIERPYVNAAGTLYPCVMLHAEEFAATGAYDRSLASAVASQIEAWSRLQEMKTSRWTRAASCRDCPDYAHCRAGCMGRAYSASGNLFAPEDRCRLRQAVYRDRDAGSVG